MSENREDAIALAVEILANDLKRLAAIVDRLVYETSPERTIPSNIVGNAAAVPSEALWVLGPPGGGSSFLYESVAPEAARLGILIPYDALFRNEEAFGQGYGNIPDLKAGSQNGTPLVSPQASEVPQNFTSQEQIEAFAQKLSESPELRALILNNPNLRDNLLNAPELAALFASEELQVQGGGYFLPTRQNIRAKDAPYALCGVWDVLELLQLVREGD
jgi:hypothetical protein